MNHSQAIETAAAERYTLNEMTAVESDEFEVHYFDCLECANDVRDYEAIRHGIRAIANPPVSRPVKWFPAAVAAIAGVKLATWLPSAAAAVLVVAFGIDQYKDRQPAIDVAAANVPLVGLSRGEASEPFVVRAGQKFPVTIDVAMEGAVRYRAEIRDAKGRVRASNDITLQQAENTISLVVGPLPAGSYDLVILGVRKDGNRSEITRHPFVVRGP